MRKAYKVRVYPDTEQAAQLSRTFGCVRLVWNKTLDARHRAYHAHGTKTAYRETDAALTVWKKTEDLAFLSEVSSVPLQQTLRHQHTAYASFFAGRAKYPRFKSRNGRQSAHYTRSAFRLRNGKLTLAKHSKPLEFVWSWDVDVLADLNPTMVVVSRESDGRWYVTFAVDAGDSDHATETGSTVGVDLGVKDFAALSTGEKIANPKNLDRKARNLARYQRQMARKQKGSANRRKARNKVAGTHRKIRNARFDFLHRTSTRLIRENDVIAIEDLNVAGMSRSVKGTIDKPGRNVRAKAGLNRTVLDAARRQLEYKAERAGKRVVVIDRWYPSSKTCSACGHLLSSLKLSVRHWRCPDCGTRHDRDHNAAKNILAAGLAVARESPGDACGAGVNLQGSSLRLSATKQELSGVSPMGIPAL
ncbi:IS200/IS605 family element transposase accessory protein TnpB [Nocardia speluncae]|uniref:IS200/IS605 family element transposase accessory protein TnpB n=1 Tax=Nocardia speluncae TaxID=419477 RepID=A0A846XI51_9NOCA|nr:RNA-guided endonuclease TnpB family protein [Nocardia speluncae]NKY33524.1 IS200/IS605 family element transposase accessory protein TnpB [Nocardia speluncae]